MYCRVMGREGLSTAVRRCVDILKGPQSQNEGMSQALDIFLTELDEIDRQSQLATGE